MDSKVTAQDLQKLAFFADVPLDQLEPLAQTGIVRTRPPRSFIYCEGDEADYVYFLLEGVVKLGNVSLRGREVIKEMVRSGTMFGELGICGEPKRQEFAFPVRMACAYICVRTSELQHLISKNAQLANAFITLLGKRANQIEKRMEDYVLTDSRSRIIELLLEFADEYGTEHKKGVRAYHFMTHQDMANYTGASRQFVTAVLNELRKNKLIDFDRTRVTILDTKGLRSAK